MFCNHLLNQTSHWKRNYIILDFNRKTIFFQIKRLKIFNLEFFSKLKYPLQGPSNIVTL